MKKTIFLFTVLCCCFINSLAQEQIEPVEYEVYKAWLEKFFITPDTKQLFILKITDFRYFNDLSKNKRRALSQIQSSTLKNYRLRNGNSLELEDNFDVKPIVNLTSEKDLSDFWANDSAYTDFGKKFGSEYRIVFSRVITERYKNC